jgi:hypothetical protein
MSGFDAAVRVLIHHTDNVGNPTRVPWKTGVNERALRRNCALNDATSVRSQPQPGRRFMM